MASTNTAQGAVKITVLLGMRRTEKYSKLSQKCEEMWMATYTDTHTHTEREYIELQKFNVSEYTVIGMTAQIKTLIEFHLFAANFCCLLRTPCTTVTKRTG